MPTGRGRSCRPAACPPFIMRFDAGSVAGRLPRLLQQDQDPRPDPGPGPHYVRPMFAALPGVSAPPRSAGNQRTIVVHATPKNCGPMTLSPDEVVNALITGNQITPSSAPFPLATRSRWWQ